MSHRMLDGVTAIGPSKSIKVGEHNTHHTVYVRYDEFGATAVSAVVLTLQGSPNNENSVTGVNTNPAVAIGSTAENVATGAFTYRINETNYSKGAVSAGTALPAGYTVAAGGTYGAFNLYINVSGTITFGFPTADQSYATAALAVAAADAITANTAGVPVSTLCYVGQVIIYNNKVAAWDSLTDDLTDTSDLTSAVFSDAPLNWYTMTTVTFSGGQLTAQAAVYTLVDNSAKFVRHNLTTLTGTGRVYSWHSAGPKS